MKSLCLNIFYIHTSLKFIAFNPAAGGVNLAVKFRRDVLPRLKAKFRHIKAHPTRCLVCPG